MQKIDRNDCPYITTPIYYVNGDPHIGHLYTSIVSDVITRFYKLHVGQAYFLTGTDEHGQKVEASAKKNNLSVQAFTDKMAGLFIQILELGHCNNDDFIRTSEERHKKGARHLWSELVDRGYIYPSTYEGWYSVREETFYLESDLINGKTPAGEEVIRLEEECYFFKLSAFTKPLLQFYDTHPDFIQPSSRYNEIKSFVKSGLRDLAVSRVGCKHGIQVPGHEEHTIYVWLDALTNYINAIGYPSDFKRDLWNNSIHVLGKDILRFHAVYWPAFLLAADMDLPKTLLVHGWWLNEGEKMSKSLNNALNPFELVEKYGADYLRYFLLKEMAFGQDGNFSHSNFVARINSELANNIGNLLQRTLKMVYKECSGSTPTCNLSEEEYNTGDLHMICGDMVEQYIDRMTSYQFDKALSVIQGISSQANIYIDRMEPWKLKKTDRPAMQKVLYIIMETMRYISVLLFPFMPKLSAEIQDNLLCLSDNQKNYASLCYQHRIEEGKEIQEPYIIFKKFDV